MNEPQKSLQNFLQRWSRRKLAGADRADAPDPQAEDTASTEAAPSSDQPQESAAAGFDPSTLPPIESIDGASDIRPFLAPGVPPDLTREALRRTWSSDPAIRNFIGLAENQWDFTNPGAVPGFGTLDLTAELREAVAKIVRGTSADAPAPAEPTDTLASGNKSSKTAPPDPAATFAAAASPIMAPAVVSAAVDSNGAVQNESFSSEPQQEPVLPRHGGALPK